MSQTTIRIDNDLRSLLWGMVDDDKKTVNAVIWYLKKEHDNMKIVIYNIKCPLCGMTAYEGKMRITDLDVNDGCLKGITCSSCGDDFDYEMPHKMIKQEGV